LLRVVVEVEKTTAAAVALEVSAQEMRCQSRREASTPLPLVVVEARQQGQPRTPLEEAVAILYLAPSLPLAAAVAAAKEP